ncbi:histone-like nucleoid-structuring protein Lsr2 [Streptomyces sp. NPDC059070]|uniref:Lsr2 family DNA-binding protein n=1 Tax=Streptomyces sp. NPDC059070 TaxID=3346713 RepID=UPI00367D8FB5
MFTDMKEALEAESLPLTASTEDQCTAAARTVARNAQDKTDLTDLLDAVGLPADEDAVTALLPLLPSPDSPGEQIMTNTRETKALSMHSEGCTRDEICEATGLPAVELAVLLPTEDTGTAPEMADLLSWAEQHELTSYRSRAARIRSDLADFTARRTSELAVGQAENEIARIAAELEQAKAKLKALKTGTPSATAAPALIGTRRSREKSTAIRTWARAHGYQVGQGGIIRQEIVDAYEAAHPSTNMRTEDV